MKIEIWSDVVCPFCYIGKKKFEAALEQFPDKHLIQVEWKSFQLMPDMEPGKPRDLEQVLTEKKGISIEQFRAMNAQLTQAGHELGITFNFDKAQAVNTTTAHRFLHFAKTSGLQNAAEEVLFRSYFTDGHNVEDHTVLIGLGKEIGMDTEKLKSILENEDFEDEVQKDIIEAQHIGVRGVPFFVFDRKQAVSGAQETEMFLQVIGSAFAEWKKSQSHDTLHTIEGTTCTPGGDCD